MRAPAAGAADRLDTVIGRERRTLGESWWADRDSNPTAPTETAENRGESVSSGGEADEPPSPESREFRDAERFGSDSPALAADLLEVARRQADDVSTFARLALAGGAR